MNTDKEIPGNVCPTCGKREWGVCSNAWHLLHDKELTPELIYLKSMDAEVNEHGVYIYISRNGRHSLNLKEILKEYGQQEEAIGYERGLEEGLLRWRNEVKELAIDFYKWVCNQAIAGRTTAKLYADYLDYLKTLPAPPQQVKEEENAGTNN